MPPTRVSPNLGSRDRDNAPVRTVGYQPDCRPRVSLDLITVSVAARLWVPRGTFWVQMPRVSTCSRRVSPSSNAPAALLGTRQRHSTNPKDVTSPPLLGGYVAAQAFLLGPGLGVSACFEQVRARCSACSALLSPAQPSPGTPVTKHPPTHLQQSYGVPTPCTRAGCRQSPDGYSGALPSSAAPQCLPPVGPSSASSIHLVLVPAQSPVHPLPFPSS